MEMNDDFFGSDVVEEKDLQSNNFVDQEGWYHFLVADIQPELSPVTQEGNDKSPSVKLKCVVQHDVDGQSPTGKLYYHEIYVGSKGGGPPKEGTIKSAMRFFIGLGVAKFIERDGRTFPVHAETGATNVNMKWFEDCIGRHFIGHLKREADYKVGEQTKRGSLKFPFGTVYAIGSPEVENVPYNKAAVEASLATASAGFTPQVKDDEEF